MDESSENSEALVDETSATLDHQSIISKLRRDPNDTVARRYERTPWNRMMKAFLLEKGAYQKDQREVFVRGIDLSKGGCALSVNRYVAQDTIIMLHLPLPGSPVVEGRVVYCQLMTGRLHRIGVEFIRLHEGNC